MLAIREIVDSSMLVNIVNLPDELKNRKVELIILPTKIENEKNISFNPENYIGTLNLKDTDKIINKIRNEWDRI